MCNKMSVKWLSSQWKKVHIYDIFYFPCNFKCKHMIIIFCFQIEFTNLKIVAATCHYKNLYCDFYDL
jgi:hypothetical protein